MRRASSKSSTIGHAQELFPLIFSHAFGTMVSRNNIPATRKRTRSKNEEEPSSTAKKPRLESSEKSPAAADADAGADLAPASKSAPTANGTLRRGRGLVAKQAAKDAPAITRKAPASKAKPRKQPKQATQQAKDETQTKKNQAPSDSQKSSVYDVPDSGEDELTTAAVVPRSKNQRPSGPGTAGDEVTPTAAANGDEVVKKKRGRPSKKDREDRAKAQNAAASSAKASTNAKTTQRASKSADPGSPSLKPLRNGTGGSDEDAEAKEGPAKRTGRARVAANARLEKHSQMPKGILTPRKEKDAANRVRKNVAFNSNLDEEALDSLATESPSKSARKRREAAEAVEEMQVMGDPKEEEQPSEEGSDNEEDDEVCAICSKPDSEPPNEIVFCDNCDTPVHQECYGLAELPEGDWICRNCSQDDVTLVNDGGPDQLESSVVAREDQRPDIPNFDQHLRSAQRVLLDRCAGTHRIRLHGQDEAYEKAYQLVEQTVVAGEGNSMMVIGARGCGKTTVGYLALVKQYEANFVLVG